MLFILKKAIRFSARLKGLSFTELGSRIVTVIYVELEDVEVV